jgi:hypothetical protein
MYKLTRKTGESRGEKIQTWSCGDELAIDKFYDGLGTCYAIFVDELNK